MKKLPAKVLKMKTNALFTYTASTDRPKNGFAETGETTTTVSSATTTHIFGF